MWHHGVNFYHCPDIEYVDLGIIEIGNFGPAGSEIALVAKPFHIANGGLLGLVTGVVDCWTAGVTEGRVACAQRPSRKCCSRREA